MARILFVAKDNGCASVTEQVAVLARDAGQEVVVAAEGLAVKRFEALGFALGEANNFRGMLDFRAPTDAEKAIHFNAAAYLDEVAPHLVVTGLGSPINIQAQIAEEATRRGIPLVVCEDFWAKSVSHLSLDKVSPTLILTVDDYSVSLVKKAFPEIRTLVVGNPGLKKIQVQESVRQQVDALRAEFGRIYVYAGGGAVSTTAELDLLMRCFLNTEGGWCLVPRFHPKYERFQAPGMEKPYGELWRDCLKPFHERIRFVDAPSTDPVAVAGDLVLSGFSTLLSTALWNGVPAACLKTAETVKSLKEHGSHYMEIPQVALGLVPAVTEPTDLSRFGMPSNEVLQKLVPYDAKNAYEYICELLP